MAGNRFSLGVLISGAGTTLRNLINRIHDGTLPVDIRVVVSSHRQAGGLAIAEAADIPTRVALPADSKTPEEFREAVFGLFREASVDLVVMAGFLKHVLIPDDFRQRVINIHPSLIPAFCGKGCYGRFVHKAVLDYGAKVSGCTVHYVDDQYDHGPIILQRTVPVREDDTPEILAKRVFSQECEALPSAILQIANHRLAIRGRHVVMRDE